MKKRGDKMKSIYAYMKKYAAMLAAQEYSPGSAARLIVETKARIWQT